MSLERAPFGRHPFCVKHFDGIFDGDFCLISATPQAQPQVSFH